MRRRKRGLNDRFPRLPPGCTPSDVDKAMGATEPWTCPECGATEPDPDHDKGCPHAEDGPGHCMVCNPPPDANVRVEYSTSLTDLPYCDNHDYDALKAKLNAERKARDSEPNRLQQDFENEHQP